MTARPNDDPLAEFNRLAVAFEAAGRLAAVTEYERVRDAFSDLRDAIECRLLTLAGEITETIGNA